MSKVRRKLNLWGHNFCTCKLASLFHRPLKAVLLRMVWRPSANPQVIISCSNVSRNIESLLFCHYDDNIIVLILIALDLHYCSACSRRCSWYIGHGYKKLETACKTVGNSVLKTSRCWWDGNRCTPCKLGGELRILCCSRAFITRYRPRIMTGSSDCRIYFSTAPYLEASDCYFVKKPKPLTATGSRIYSYTVIQTPT